MSRYKVSPEWTDKDRFEVISQIAYDMKIVANSQKLFEVFERILFLCEQDKQFLEANRDAIINGK